MLFSATGATLSAHIRARRLAAMRRDLADPRLSDRSITEIALNWGFSDSAHASRAFSAAFGQSPSLFRAAAGSRPDEARQSIRSAARDRSEARQPRPDLARKAARLSGVERVHVVVRRHRASAPRRAERAHAAQDGLAAGLAHQERPPAAARRRW